MNDRDEFIDTLTSPIGTLTVRVNSEAALVAIHFENEVVTGRRDKHQCHRVIQQLNEYFAGLRRDFNLPLAPIGSPFQTKVWQTLCKIPYGETISYQTLATQIGNPKASRAVGSANGANPIPIIIPCHRVITSDSRLGGYAGGLAAKRILLQLEGASPELF